MCATINYIAPPLGATLKTEGLRQTDEILQTRGKGDSQANDIAYRTNGVSYRVWAPAIAQIQVDIQTSRGETRSLPLKRDHQGYHTGSDPHGHAGDTYYYQLPDGKGSFPDPVSRAQQTDVRGRSVVVDSKSYFWRDTQWRRPSFRDLILYELHIGTFTTEGTFLSACAHLSLLRELGVTAIEIMPIADFPGTRNWGYDGVLPYAPARCYGSPDDLRTLVDCAHSNNLAVILDVVYNHFGPSGNCLTHFTPLYFNGDHPTPWGDSFNFDSPPVREFFIQNPIYWMEEFHIDGFRLDATHAIYDNSQPHILAEITEAIHQRGGYAIAEDDRNANYLIESVGQGGMGFDAVWADDLHHALRVTQTKENTSYFLNYRGSLAEVISTLDSGWLYCGQSYPQNGLPRGTKGKHLPPERFIHCISNHDQTGNQAMGKRLSQFISPAAYRTLSALLCLSPYIPLIFMGQEWAASTPFLYFTDHESELGKQISEGRRREFSEFPEFRDPASQKQIPDPQAKETFLHSKLQWQEINKDKHAQIRLLYKECLAFRQLLLTSQLTHRENWEVRELSWQTGQIHYKSKQTEYLIVFDLLGNHAGPLEVQGENWLPLLSTEEKRFGGQEAISFTSHPPTLSFSEIGLLFLTRQISPLHPARS